MRYKYEGSNGGYPLSDTDTQEQEDTICSLCLEKCNDNFELMPISSSVKIILCHECASQDKSDLDYILNYYKKDKHIDND